jgi:hypothetical protein
MNASHKGNAIRRRDYSSNKIQIKRKSVRKINAFDEDRISGHPNQKGKKMKREESLWTSIPNNPQKNRRELRSLLSTFLHKTAPIPTISAPWIPHLQHVKQ